MTENDCSRRRFLGLMAASLPGLSMLRGTVAAMAGEKPQQAGTAHPKNTRPSIGIALGAGGANGLAHILMLEALDDMGIQAAHISGSSIGAIIGSLYAAGMSGKEIRGSQSLLNIDAFVDPTAYTLVVPESGRLDS